MQLGQVAGQQQADLVGEDLLALVVDHAAAVAIAIEADAEVRAMLASPPADIETQHLDGLPGSDCISGSCNRGWQSISITSPPIARRASGANAPAAPLPHAAITFSLRVSLVFLATSAM